MVIFGAMKTTLYLIPTGLGGGEATDYLPAGVIRRLHSLTLFFVESVRTARRFLRATGFEGDLSALRFHELSEHTPPQETEALLALLLSEGSAGLLSEAGLPAVADPGASLVALCHRHGVQVVPLTGPSSLFLALMASGLNGQHFTFHGYLPRERQALVRALREMERLARHEGSSHLFMETPYRNDRLFGEILRCCHPDTLLCVAASLTTSTEFILTREIAAWKASGYMPGRQPVIFILGSQPGPRH